jgi:hypothetical protein
MGDTRQFANTSAVDPVQASPQPTICSDPQSRYGNAYLAAMLRNRSGSQLCAAETPMAQQAAVASADREYVNCLMSGEKPLSHEKGQNCLNAALRALSTVAKVPAEKLWMQQNAEKAEAARSDEAGIVDETAYQDLTVVVYTNCLDVRLKPGESTCDGATSPVASTGRQAAVKTNAKPHKKQFNIPISQPSDIARNLDLYLGEPSNDTYSIKELRLVTGHGLMVNTDKLKSIFGSEKASRLREIYGEDPVAMIQLGDAYITVLDLAAQQELDLHWSGDAQVKLLACSVGQDRRMMTAMQTWLSGGRATLLASNKPNPGGNVHSDINENMNRVNVLQAQP